MHGDKLPADLELALVAAPMLPDEVQANVVRHSFQTIEYASGRLWKLAEDEATD